MNIINHKHPVKDIPLCLPRTSIREPHDLGFRGRTAGARAARGPWRTPALLTVAPLVTAARNRNSRGNPTRDSARSTRALQQSARMMVASAEVNRIPFSLLALIATAASCSTVRAICAGNDRVWYGNEFNKYRLYIICSNNNRLSIAPVGWAAKWELDYYWLSLI